MARILIVEDNELNRELLIQLLEDEHAIVTAADGEEGVARALAELPELILMDLSMPGVDGFEAHARLRADDKTKHIPIIAVTAHAIRGDRERVLGLGFDGYISKPVDEELLMQTIAQTLNDTPKRGPS